MAPGRGRSQPETALLTLPMLEHNVFGPIFGQPRRASAVAGGELWRRQRYRQNADAIKSQKGRTCVSTVRRSAATISPYRSRSRWAAATLTSCGGTCFTTGRPSLSKTIAGICWFIRPANTSATITCAGSTRLAPRSVATTARMSVSSKTTGVTTCISKRRNRSTNTRTPCSGPSSPTRTIPNRAQFAAGSRARCRWLRCAARRRWRQRNESARPVPDPFWRESESPPPPRSPNRWHESNRER